MRIIEPDMTDTKSKADFTDKTSPEFPASWLLDQLKAANETIENLKESIDCYANEHISHQETIVNLTSDMTYINEKRMEEADDYTKLAGELGKSRRENKELKEEVSRKADYDKRVINALEAWTRKLSKDLDKSQWETADCKDLIACKNTRIEVLEETIAKKNITIEWFNEQYLKAREVLNGY